VAVTATGAAKSSLQSEMSSISSKAAADASSIRSEASAAAASATHTTSPNAGPMMTAAPMFGAAAMGMALYLI
jgi:hypothetical protein